MGDINTDRKKFGLTRRQFNFFVCISVLLLAFCFSLFIPPIRNLIIRFGEILVHRPINHPYWHKIFIGISIGGLVLCAFFLEFIYLYISQITAGRISNIYAITFSLIFVFVFVFAIMYKANWFYIDQLHIIKTTAVNKYFSKYRPGNDGRFTPFGWIHYNLLLLVFRCLGINTGLPVEAHYAVISIFFIVTFFCLYFLFVRIEPVKTKGAYSLVNCFFACTFIILGGDFFFIYSCLVSFETQVIMMFAVFMLMYYKALKTDKIRYYIVAFLSAVYSTYCKEPVFDVFLVIAFVNYLFRYNKSKREKLFYIALIANSLFFIILYYFLSFKYKSAAFYHGWDSRKGFEFLLSIFIRCPVLIIMSCFGLIRLYFVIVRKERDFLFYDSLLFAGIAYTFPLFILHLNSAYYFIPPIILFLPSLVHWIKYFLEKKRAFAFALFFVLLPVQLYHSGHILTQINNIRRQQQEYIPYLTELLSDYKSGKEFIWYESDNGVTDDTIYIIVRNMKKAMVNTFLNYLNKSEGIDFFIVEHNMDHITMNQNILFFYPYENDQYQPMPDLLIKILQDNNFTLYKFFNGTWTYKQY